MSRDRTSWPRRVLAVALSAIAPVAIAQAVLSPAEGAPGSRQTLRFRVPEACGGAPRTQEVAIRLPWRFRLLCALPREGWEVGVQPAGHRVALGPGLASLALQRIDGPLAEGEHLPVTLRFEGATGLLSERVLQVPVHRVAPPGADERS